MHFYERDYDFVEIATKAVEDARKLFEERDVTLVVEPAPAGLAARGDPEKLKRAMAHVLDNSAKFSARGGVVAVGVRRGRNDGEDWLGFEVADDGPGVAPDQHNKILEPFYQVDGSVTRSHGGVGLGLAFAKYVCEAMGGRVDVESPPASEIAGRKLNGTLVRLCVARQSPPLA
jgi:signal transduction histidine kinase